MMNEKTLAVSHCLADMAQATAWINFTAAQANHDVARYGEWRCDYATQACGFQRDYEVAEREFVALTKATDEHKPSKEQQ